MRKKTHEEYEQELFEREIDYWPLERYVTNNTKILHECLEGHRWSARPTNILSGDGCPVCTGNVKKTTESYILDLIAKDIVYRPIEPYLNIRTKILHECPKKHQWFVKPRDILWGYGCPTCSKHGFDPYKSAKLYFFSFEHDEITYYKVGITNNSAQKRHSTDWGLLKIKLLWEIEYESGADAREAEKKILQDNKEFLINTGALLSGNTETFTVYIEPPKLADVV